MLPPCMLKCNCQTKGHLKRAIAGFHGIIFVAGVNVFFFVLGRVISRLACSCQLLIKIKDICSIYRTRAEAFICTQKTTEFSNQIICGGGMLSL